MDGQMAAVADKGRRHAKEDTGEGLKVAPRLPLSNALTRSRQRRSPGSYTRLVVYLSPEDIARLETVRESIRSLRGRRPSVGIVTSAAISALFGELFACQ